MKKGFCAIAVLVLAAAIAASAYPQTASSPAASAQGQAPELRVAAFVAPPGVMEQNGTLTGFSVDLWNAIAARLKVKTSYQILPDVSHLEEALRSKNADLTVGLFITSARDEVFDFSIPTLQGSSADATGAASGRAGSSSRADSMWRRWRWPTRTRASSGRCSRAAITIGRQSLPTQATKLLDQTLLSEEHVSPWLRRSFCR